MPPKPNRFDQLIDQFDPILRKAFMDAIYAIRDSVQIAALAKMLERGDIEGALRAIGLDPIQFRQFDKAIAAAFEAGGNYTAAGFPATVAADGLKVVFQFNVRNLFAENWLRARSSEKITEIVTDQRNMIRAHLTAGMEAGQNPRTVALDIAGRINRVTGKREGGVLGLTNSQAEWVRAYRAELASATPSKALTRNLRDKRFDAVVRRAQAAGEPIPADKIDAMVTAYQNRALRYRAETIGRTEAMASLHASQEEAVRQGVQAGAIQQSKLKQIWRTARDARVRDSHRSMSGQTVARGEMFTTGTGVNLAYPGDPNGPATEVINCRCYREMKYDFLAGVR